MSKCWYCNNELTTGDNPKHFGICNKCYDEMFKSNDIIIRSFTNKIADLEAKLVEKENEIEKLEEQLKNAIIPKYKTGDKVYGIIDTWAYTDVFPVEIRDTHLLYEVWDGEDTTKQHSTRIFATKEEAEAKLQELKVGR